LNKLSTLSIIIKNLGVKSILDVGCRDGKLKDFLDPVIQYYGNDLIQSENVHFLGDILIIDIHMKFDCVVAIDILEHTDNPYLVSEKLLNLADRFLIINLPNTYDLKSRVKFFFTGHLGGKYTFLEHNQTDRHRWLMNHNEIIRFYKSFAFKYDLTMELAEIKYGGGERTFVSALFKILRLLPASLSTASIIGIFKLS